MKHVRRSGLLTAVILWVAVVNLVVQLSFGPNVRAADVRGADLTGDTFVSTQSCDATVDGTYPGSLDVTSGDNVLIYYHINWTDTRPSSSVKARHEFWFDVAYGPSFWEQDGTRFNTTGDESGSDWFLITVPSVIDSGYVYLNWTNAIDENEGQCVDTDGAFDKILLY